MIGLTKLCQMIKLSSLLTCGDVVYFKAYTVYIYIYMYIYGKFSMGIDWTSKKRSKIRDRDCVTVSVIRIDPHRLGKKSVVTTQDKCPLVTRMLFSSWESNFRINSSLFWEPAKQTNEETNKRTNERTNKQTNKQTNERTNEQTNKQTNKETYKHVVMKLGVGFTYTRIIYIPILLTT